MRIKDYTDTIRHLTDPFNIPEARRMIQENPALTQEQFKAGGIVEPGVTHYGKKVKRESTYHHTGAPTGGGVPADDAKKAYIKKRAKQLGFDAPNFTEFPTRGYPSSMTKAQQIAKGYDEAIREGYKKFPDTPKRTFTTKERNLIKNNFKGIDFNKGSYGVKYSENKKLFQNVVDFVERGFVKSTIEKLPSKDRKEIIEMFGDEWGKPFQFDDFRYGIPDSAGKNKNIAQRIRAYSEGYGDVKLTGPSWIRRPEGAILAAMKRAPDKYEGVLKGGKLAGYKNLETGETYFHKNYTGKLKAKEFNITNHPDYNKTLKFYNIAKEAKMPPTETIYKLFAKAGFDTKGLRFNDLLRYLTHTTDFTTTANAIEIHHTDTVAGKLGNLQILRADLNKLADTETRRILKIADPGERAAKIKLLNTQFKERGVRSILPDGTVIGVRKESAEKGLKRIQDFVIEGGEVGGSLEKMTQVKGVKDWKAKDFKAFETWIKKFPCKRGTGGPVDINCHIEGMRHEKNLVKSGQGSRAMANKFIEGTTLARKGKFGTASRGLLKGTVVGDLLFEGAYAGYNWLQGEDAADIWKLSWYSFADPNLWKDGKYMGWMEDAEQAKVYTREDGSIIPEIKRYVDNANKLQKQFDLQDNVFQASLQDPTMQVGGEEIKKEKLLKAKKELSDFSTRMNLEGGEGQLYKDLERDQKAFLEREEVVGARKLQKKIDRFEWLKSKGAFPEDKEFLSPIKAEKLAQRRDEAMEEKFPTYTREQLDEMLESWGANTPWNLGFESGVKGYDQMGEWLKTHDKYKDMEAGVANIAEGGRVSYLDGGIVSLLKK